MSKSKIYIIAGGGTGGHIYPGIAVAKSLKKSDPQCEVVFVGTPSGLEVKIVPREGFDLKLIEVGKLNYGGGLIGKIKTVLRLPLAFIQSFQILKNLEPAAVLGVGGYASGPFVLTASFMGFRTAIWEGNAYPGLTNRWLSRFVQKSFLVFEDAKNWMHSQRSEVVGLPVRSEIENPLPLNTSSTFRILVFGGSQGARAINKVVSDAVLKGGSWLDGVKIVHQTGALDYADLKKKYHGYEHHVDVREFLFDMNVQYANSDLVICRGGASTVTELTASGKVALIVPLPTAADNHQQKNAETLVRNEAGLMILQKDFTPDRLIEEVEKIRANPVRREQMANNIRKLFIPKAADRIAHDLQEGWAP